MQPSFLSIKTARLTLRPLVAEDAAILYRIYQTEGVLKYFPNPHPPPLEKVQNFIQSQQAHWLKYGYGNWGIQVDGEKEIIGWAGLQYLPELETTEVGFLLDRPFWGYGYATEVARASLDYGFGHCRLKTILALVHPQNAASQRVIEKCGMVYRETLTLWGIELRCYRLERVCRQKP